MAERGSETVRPAGQTAGGRWHAVLTLPRREALALEQLRNQGFEAWLPQRLRTVRHARRAQLTQRPLFPRYLFVRFDAGRTRWRSINGTFGVVRLVSFGDQPAPVPRGVVEGLKAMAGPDGVVRLEDRLKPGERVRLAAGPFAEEIGVIARLEGPSAVRLLLDMMGRRVKVRAAPEQVLPAA